MNKSQCRKWELEVMEQDFGEMEVKRIWNMDMKT